jgi:hypothetical protein
MASRPLAVALVVVTLITALRLTGTVDSDVAWQLWIAGRMHDGANLYRDIIETNPPLWFWMAQPIERLSAVLHVRIEAVLIVAIGVAVGCSLAATARLITHVEPGRRTLLLAYGALALAGMPWMHVGQREQIVMIGAVPYAALIAARREQVVVPALLAAAIGAGAALGFALKHYFLIVPALLELWLLARQTRRWRPIRPETAALVVVGAAYAAAILVFERDFLLNIVPLLGQAYGSFAAPSLRYLFGPFALAGLALLSMVALHARFLKQAPFASAAVVAAVGFTIAYFIQFKGWAYHTIPITGFAGLAMVALLVESSAPLRPLRLAAPALLSLPLFLAVEEQLHPVFPSPDLREAVSGLRRGDPVGFLTTETAIPWSVTLQGGYAYASRYNGFWMMPAILRNEQRGTPDPRLTDLSRRIVTETIADFTCTPPRRIIVSRPRPGEDGFDILAFFLRDPGFAALLSHYRATSRTSLEVYELSVPLPAPPRGCRRVGP